MGWTMQGSNPGWDRIFLLSKMPRNVLGPHSLLFNGYRDSFLGVKQLGHDVNQWTPPSAGANNEWSYTSTPPIRLHDIDRG